MAAITHPRFNFPYTGRRYGSFSGKPFNNVPDFMHGNLRVFPSLAGDINARPHVSGKVQVRPHLTGEIGINP